MKKLKFLLASAGVIFSIESSGSDQCQADMKKLASPALKKMREWVSLELTDSMVDTARRSYAQAYKSLDSKDIGVNDRTIQGVMSLINAVQNGHPDAFQDLIFMGGGFFTERYGIEAFLGEKELHDAKGKYSLSLRKRWNSKVHLEAPSGPLKRIWGCLFAPSKARPPVLERERRVSDSLVIISGEGAPRKNSHSSLNKEKID